MKKNFYTVSLPIELSEEQLDDVKMVAAATQSTPEDVVVAATMLGLLNILDECGHYEKDLEAFLGYLETYADRGEALSPKMPPSRVRLLSRLYARSLASRAPEKPAYRCETDSEEVLVIDREGKPKVIVPYAPAEARDGEGFSGRMSKTAARRVARSIAAVLRN